MTQLLEVKKLVDEINTTVHALSQSHEENEKRRDGVAEEKIARIDEDINKLEVKIEALKNEVTAGNRPNIGQEKNPSDPREINLFMNLLRNSNGGITNSQDYNSTIAEMRGQEFNHGSFYYKKGPYGAVKVSDAASGGIRIPQIVENGITKPLEERSVGRQIFSVGPVSSENYKKIYQNGKHDAGWVGENDPRVETGTPLYFEALLTAGSVYAMPLASLEAIHEMPNEVIADLIAGGQEGFIRKEEDAFLNGDGIKKPKGLLNQAMDTADDDTRSMEKFQIIETAVKAKLAANDVDISNLLIDVIDKLNVGFKANATWLMDTTTLNRLRKIRDNDGNLIYQTPTVDRPPNFHGFSYHIHPFFPKVEAGKIAIGLGDWKAAWHIKDFPGIYVDSARRTGSNMVEVYMQKKVGTILGNTQAAKFVKVKA